MVFDNDMYFRICRILETVPYEKPIGSLCSLPFENLSSEITDTVVLYLTTGGPEDGRIGCWIAENILKTTFATAFFWIIYNDPPVCIGAGGKPSVCIS